MGAQTQLHNLFDPIVRRCKIQANLFVVVVRVNNQNRNQKQLVASHYGVKLKPIQNGSHLYIILPPLKVTQCLQTPLLLPEFFPIGQWNRLK